MEISRLDAWYSDKDGSLDCPATYIVKGLCRRCCIPEVILRCLQVSPSVALTLYLSLNYGLCFDHSKWGIDLLTPNRQCGACFLSGIFRFVFLSREQESFQIAMIS